MSARLSETLDRVTARSAAAVVAQGRLRPEALNRALLRRLSAAPGEEDSLFAEPVLEARRAWKPADRTLGELAGDLLHPDLIDALDGAEAARMPRDLTPYAHQLAAWEAAREGMSCLVTSGTGSGKTECFMVPMLDDLLRTPGSGRLVGVRAIVIYPLNALIESQRERLAAWTAPTRKRLRFALYNGLTPERQAQVTRKLAPAELGDRRSIREEPPAILVTNVTMLEYLLLRAQDRSLLDASEGLLRWIVLDEAHGYIGAQAAEMALLLRRVRAAFGVAPEDVRLMATSATISEGEGTRDRLEAFVADLAGVSTDRVRVIEGEPLSRPLPRPGHDHPIDPASLEGLDETVLWERLSIHPRIQAARAALEGGGCTLPVLADMVSPPGEGGDDRARRARAEAILAAAARARDPGDGHRLLPWHAHLFHRAQGGMWVCVDPACPKRDPELVEAGEDWGFGQIWLKRRDHCTCGAPTFELKACTECGTGHLEAAIAYGALDHLEPCREDGFDEFAADIEPDPDDETGPVARGRVLLRPASGGPRVRHLSVEDGALYGNGPPEEGRVVALDVIEEPAERGCCAGAADARLMPQRYGPAFFMGNAVPLMLEGFAAPAGEPGLPAAGRRMLTFSDSRQGTARLAAKLQQDAERNLVRAFLYHAVQEETGPDAEERAKLLAKLEKLRQIPDLFADDIAAIEKTLAGAGEAVRWVDLVSRLSRHVELENFAADVWRGRGWGGREMAEKPELLAEMFLLRELFRRPRVQNNAETMGLVRLSFPDMERRARATVPAAVRDAGLDADTWCTLALTAVDFGFRDVLATDIQPTSFLRWISCRSMDLI